jgi:hypothetical protein
VFRSCNTHSFVCLHSYFSCQSDRAACIAALHPCLALCHPLLRSAVQLHLLAVHAVFVEAPATASTESPTAPLTLTPSAPASATFGSSSSNSATPSTAPAANPFALAAASDLQTLRASAATAAGTATLLARARRLFDPTAFATLPAELREAVHAFVMQDLIARTLPTMLACYCEAHQVSPPQVDVPWVTQLRSMLEVTKEDWSPTGFVEHALAGHDMSALPEKSLFLAIAAAAYPLVGQDPPSVAPASLIDKSAGWSSAQVSRSLASHEALLWMFGLTGKHESMQVSLQHVSSSIPFNATVHTLVREATAHTEPTGSDKDSLPALVDSLSTRYSLSDVLDYRHYLRQGRPLAAFNAHGASEPRPATITSTIALAVEHFSDNRVLTACLVFFRCLPITRESLALHCGMARDYVEAARKIFFHETQMLGIVFTKCVAAACSPFGVLCST